ncbi:cytochrome P450 [Streptomyces sp. NPDC059247]|uniref:cytochrome P450 n=1 Tax=Streptomyces sp. NPDC059247 TaxID=3346790 RepID=UPI0036CD3A43
MTKTRPGTPVPGNLPLLGHVLRLARDPAGFLASLPAHGDLVQVRLGPVRAWAVCDPELLHRVLSDVAAFEKGGVIYDRTRREAGNGIITCRNSEHPAQRELIWPTFRRAHLPVHAAVMNDQINRSIAPWHDGQVLDLVPEAASIGARATARALFPGLREQELQQLTRSFDDFLTGLLRRMTWPSALPGRLPGPGDRRYRRARTHIRRTVSALVAAPDAGGPDDLIPTLLAARNPSGHPLTPDEIHDQVFNLLIAGVDTTASTLAWALYLVATHPETQRQLHDEVDTVLGGRPVRYEDLDRLDTVQRVLTETLRLYPSAWMFTRTTVAATELAGVRLPAGATLVCSPYLMHRRADLYPDPERFDPGRWLDRRTTDLPRGGYVPFGAGTRTCIGRFFGMTGASLALAAVAARWHLTPAGTAPVRPLPRATMSARSMPVRLRARKLL